MRKQDKVSGLLAIASIIGMIGSFLSLILLGSEEAFMLLFFLSMVCLAFALVVVNHNKY